MFYVSKTRFVTFHSLEFNGLSLARDTGLTLREVIMFLFCYSIITRDTLAKSVHFRKGTNVNGISIFRR